MSPGAARTFAGAALIVAALLTGGCGGKDPGTAAVASIGSASSSIGSAGGATPSPSGTADPFAYSACMRSHGVPGFPDPQDGRITLDGDTLGTDPKGKVFTDADAACTALLPPRVAAGQDSQAAREARLKYSQCMRENGVPAFPDPKADGTLQVNGNKLGTGPGDPAFDQADKACQHFMADLGPAEGPGLTQKT